jgi:hypothetical protein
VTATRKRLGTEEEGEEEDTNTPLMIMLLVM